MTSEPDAAALDDLPPDLNRGLLTRAGVAGAQWKGELKAVSWLLSGDTVGRLVSQAAIVMTARLLGPTQYGTLAVAIGAFSLATVIADLGVGDAAVQRLTRSAGGAETFRREVAPLRVVLASPLLPIGVLVALAASSPWLRAVGLLVAAAPWASLISSRVLAARVSERFGAAGTWTATLGLCQSVGALGAAVIAPTGLAAATGIAFSIVGIGLAAHKVAARHLPDSTSMRAWITRGVPFGLTAGAVAFYSRVDRIVIAAIDGTAAAGEYVAAYNVVMIAAIAGAALGAAVLPRFLVENRFGLDPRWRRRGVVLALAVAPAALLLLLFSSEVMRVLYGAQFEASPNVLRILAPLVVLYIVNPFLAALLIAGSQQRALAGIAAASAGVALVAYPAFTWAFGSAGTATASVLVELLSTALVCRALLRRGSTIGSDSAQRDQDPSASLGSDLTR